MRLIVGLPAWGLGGPCIFARRLVEGLARQGWDTHILLTEANCSRLASPGGPAAPPCCQELPAGPDDLWGLRWEALLRYLEERAPCFYLMLHDWRNNCVAARLSDRVRLIGLIQADDELEYSQAARIGHFWNAGVAVSDLIHYKVAHRLPHLAPRLVTIRNAVPTLAAPPDKPDGPLRIAYCGELRAHQKRLPDLVAVAGELTARGVDFELNVFGDGELRDRLAGPGLRLRGALANAALLRELESHHAFLLTSEYEGLSIALLEAMSRACVPVVTRLATQDLVVRSGENALTAPIGDVAGLASALQRLAADRSELRRLAGAAFATVAQGYGEETMLRSYAELAATLERPRFRRERGWLEGPPERVGSVGILPGYRHLREDVLAVNSRVPWPDPAPLAKRAPLPGRSPLLEEHRVILAIPAGQLSGVDVFAGLLARGLARRGLEARIVGRRALEHPMGLPLPDDVPLDPPPEGSWKQRWKAMAAYLESQAPCFYLPNYDYEHAAVAPMLSERVKVVTVCHSDDPAHYEQAVRLAPYADGTVAVSRAVAEHLAGLHVSARVVPYGVEVPPWRERPVRDRLRIVYAGRLESYQKRVLDLVPIAASLERRGVPFELAVLGTGDELQTLLAQGHEQVMRRCLWLPGKLARSEVLEQLADCDAFVLPSAFEGLSLGLLEAMARGAVPVVSAMRSGRPEVVRDGENGFVVPIADAEGFADRLERLYRRPEERSRLARAAYATVAGAFTDEQMVDGYLGCFQSILDSPVRRPRGGPVPPAWLRSQLDWRTRAWCL